MITKNFQKLGALVASLVSILTLSSAAEAIVISSPAVTTSIGATGASRMQTIKTQAYSNASALPLTLESFNKIIIKGLNLSTNGNKLFASLSLIDPSQGGEMVGTTGMVDFTGSIGSGSGITTGNYTFSTASSTPWPTTGYSSSTIYALNPADFTQFIGADVSGKQWQLDLMNGVTNSGNGSGSLTGFSVDATVPFESDAAPAGVAIVVGAFVLRRKLQQRSAQKMSLESVNS
ncbi:hypothetical protein BMF77_02731 [Dolichospermum sp. UHCC 0315A]|uniref:hypothetical protein n=1 Tax=Dolichospermum sp. UHCC 0315A TaxID=1914871 RepID=UPI0011E7B65E|nr:hypothetical protein [Dolichospermum sp. UHCC 0315A]QEI42125.1 hypothetical protein BMF77_02731 [Dolichospermum sp. UHCC 0315A]